MVLIKVMMKKLAELLLLVFFLSVLLTANAITYELPEIDGNFFARFPGKKKFVAATDSVSLIENTIILVRPDVRQPLASDSQLIIGSHSITLFPGSSARLTRGGLYPLSGRLEIKTELPSAPIYIHGKKFFLQYESGHLMIEVTPDSGTYLVMRNKGQAFVKDLDRQIVELETDQEIYFPIFGTMKINSRQSSFWSLAPTGFSAARSADAFAEEKTDADEDQSDNATDENAISSSTVKLEAAELSAVEVSSATYLKLIPEVPAFSELPDNKQSQISQP